MERIPKKAIDRNLPNTGAEFFRSCEIELKMGLFFFDDIENTTSQFKGALGKAKNEQCHQFYCEKFMVGKKEECFSSFCGLFKFGTTRKAMLIRADLSISPSASHHVMRLSSCVTVLL